MKQIEINPIGVIRTPYKNHEDIPIQGKFKPHTEGWIELNKEYEPGLMGLDEFSHAILIYHFFDSEIVALEGGAFLDDDLHGIFSIRSPHRPNHIGMSIVRIKCIKENILRFDYVDMMDGTPLLDIKPYVTHFDCFSDAKSGWIDPHFDDGNVPSRTTQKNTKNM